MNVSSRSRSHHYLLAYQLILTLGRTLSLILQRIFILLLTRILIFTLQPSPIPTPSAMLMLLSHEHNPRGIPSRPLEATVTTKAALQTQ